MFAVFLPNMLICPVQKITPLRQYKKKRKAATANKQYEQHPKL